MDESAILETLQTAVTTAVSESTVDSDMPVAYINKDFDIPTDGRWLQLVWLPNNRRGDFIGTEKNYRGILRLVLHWPKKGTDAYAPLQWLESVTLYFEENRLLSGVQFYEIPDFTGPLTEEDESLWPIDVRYMSCRS